MCLHFFNNTRLFSFVFSQDFSPFGLFCSLFKCSLLHLFQNVCCICDIRCYKPSMFNRKWERSCSRNEVKADHFRKTAESLELRMGSICANSVPNISNCKCTFPIIRTKWSTVCYCGTPNPAPMWRTCRDQFVNICLLIYRSKKFVVLPLFTIVWLPRRAMNQLRIIMKASVDELETASVCTAYVTIHTNQEI